MTDAPTIQVTIMGPARPPETTAELLPEAIAFARWLDGDDESMPPSASLRAEFAAIDRYRGALETAVLNLQRELMAGYERNLHDHDMPSAAHEFTAGYKAGAANVAAHAAGRLSTALDAAIRAAQ